MLDLLKQVNTLRGSMTLEELQELVIKKISKQEIDNEFKDNSTKEIIKQLENKTVHELQSIYYDLQIMNRHSVSTYTESIESLSLEIFKTYSNQNSLLDLGSGTGHMLWRANKEGHFKYLRGEEINHNVAEISEQLLSQSETNIEIKKIDSTLNFGSNDKFECIYSDALFLNADNKRLKQIEDSASNSYLKTRSKFSEWIFTNRILNNLEDKGVGTIVVRNAATFTEMAKDIRKELIEKNLIKAVIQLPSNLITNTAIPTTLLILQKDNSDKITFIDASEIYTQKGRMQNTFEDENITTIMKALEEETEISVKVNKQEVKDNDYNLSPIRYLVNIEDRLVSPTELTNIVETIRGKDVSKKRLDEEESKDKSGYLLNLSDVKDYKIDTPKQQISQDILDEYERYLLKPKDIVLSTRSSDLKIAIVTESLAKDNLIISSNFNILRIKDDKVSPYYLFAFLTSEIGVEQLKQLMTGTVINVISQKSLQEYKVSMLDEETQEDIAFKMEEELLEYYSYLKKVKNFKEKLPQLFNENGGE
jgi:type I restriction enzyme M protein